MTDYNRNDNEDTYGGQASQGEQPQSQYGYDQQNQQWGQPQNPHQQAQQPYGHQYNQQQNEVMLMEYPGGEKRWVKLGSRGARFGAYLIDSIISGIPTTILTFIFMYGFFRQMMNMPFWVMQGQLTDEELERFMREFFFGSGTNFFTYLIGWILIILAVSLVVQALYYGLIPVLTKGRTLGKMMLSLRAVSDNGQYLTTGGQWIRGLLGFTLLSLVTSGITIVVSAIMVLVTDKRQGIHDYMASSVVISEKPF